MLFWGKQHDFYNMKRSVSKPKAVGTFSKKELMPKMNSGINVN